MVQSLNPARLLDQVLGHTEIINRFLNSYQNGHLPHSFLFVGPSGVGKKKTALALAQALVCDKSDLTSEHASIEKMACGFCGPCQRILKGNSESLLLIEPEKNLIKIEQAHQVLEFLNLRSIGRHRIVIIDQADCLNPQAGNSLLKVIEEPPPGTFFFLIAPSPVQVLMTLRSRSQIVNFSPVPLDLIRKNHSAPDWAIRASLGSFERLQQLTSKEELEIRESAVFWLEDLMNNSLGYLRSEHRDVVRDRSVAGRLSLHLSWFFRDAAYVAAGQADKVLNLDKMNLLQKLSETLSADQLFEACEKSLAIQNKLDANFDSSLTFEEFWIKTRPMLDSENQVNREGGFR